MTNMIDHHLIITFGFYFHDMKDKRCLSFLSLRYFSKFEVVHFIISRFESLRSLMRIKNLIKILSHHLVNSLSILSPTYPLGPTLKPSSHLPPSGGRL